MKWRQIIRLPGASTSLSSALVSSPEAPNQKFACNYFLSSNACHIMPQYACPILHYFTDLTSVTQYPQYTCLRMYSEVFCFYNAMAIVSAAKSVLDRLADPSEHDVRNM